MPQQHRQRFWGQTTQTSSKIFTLMGTVSPNFPTDVTLGKSKEVLLIDKTPIKSACPGKPGALGGWKATYTAITNPCQTKHFSCYNVLVLCKLTAENERTEAVSDSPFVCFPFTQKSKQDCLKYCLQKLLVAPTPVFF